MALYCKTILLLFSLAFQSNGFSQYKEHTVKVDYIEKLTDFIKWPDLSEMRDTSNYFYVYVIGDNEFGKLVRQAYKNRKLNNKNVKVVTQKNIKLESPIHLLYLARNNRDQLREAIKICRLTPFLIVSETKGFGHLGAHINFYQTEKQVHFEINKHSLDGSGFHADYLLLEFAKVILN